MEAMRKQKIAFPIEGSMATNLDSILAALADPTRRRVIDSLRVQPRRAGELASAFQMSAPAMSRHLRLLRHTGIVEEEHGHFHDARLRVYRLRHRPFADLRKWVAEIETFWTDQLDAFKAHAERTRKGKRK